MKCEQVKELLSAYLDTMLAPEELDQVSAHLQRCSTCCALLADFRRFDALLSNLPRVSPDPLLHEKLFLIEGYRRAAEEGLSHHANKLSSARTWQSDWFATLPIDRDSGSPTCNHTDAGRSSSAFLLYGYSHGLLLRSGMLERARRARKRHRSSHPPQRRTE